MLDLLLLFTGLILGLTVGYFIALHRSRSTCALQLSQLKEELMQQKSLTTATNAMLADKKHALELAAAGLENKQQQINRLTGELNAERNELKNVRQQLLEKQGEIERTQAQLLGQFENLSNKVIKDQAHSFRTTSTEQLENVLKPLREKITSFEQKVQDTYEKSLHDATSLTEQIKQLNTLNQQLGKDAVNLTKALRGDKKMQGNWGEMLLETLLDKSGLEKNVHYRPQATHQSDEGQLFRPDIIIDLPEGKHLVIDSKVSLVAYLEFHQCSDDAQTARHLDDHCRALRNHVQALGGKKYEQLLNINTPDFVLMFVPNEPAFNVAMGHDPDLFNYALSRNVVIVTTSTLLATLRTVSSLWRSENQKRNVLEIAEESGKLYDKFVGFVEDMEGIGKHLESTSKAYSGAMNKLTEGKGNLVGRTERLRKLGAKTTKTLPAQLLAADAAQFA